MVLLRGEVLKISANATVLTDYLKAPMLQSCKNYVHALRLARAMHKCYLFSSLNWELEITCKSIENENIGSYLIS